MKRIVSVFVVMTLLLVVFPTAATASRAMPIRGTVMGEHGPPDFTDQSCLDAGYLWRFSSAGSDGVGGAWHLGDVAEYHLTQCTRPGPDGFESVGTITLIAADGDELWLEHTMLSQLVGAWDPDPDGFRFQGAWKAYGGTGRFSSAAGNGVLGGAGDIPDGTAWFGGIPDGLLQLNFKGKIAFDS